ncbi:MAG: hypothetical protein ACLQIB_57580 [Isosphaeraceae bacterium]
MPSIESDAIVKEFCKHFVSLAIEYTTAPTGRGTSPATHPRAPDASARDMACFSGYIMEVEGYWRLVTAGHIILNIESALKNGSVRIVRSNLIDCFGAGAKYFHPYHFPYEKEERYYEDDKDTRTDFGFISIPPLICRNLEANKIVPVDWRNWMSQESGDFEAFFMLGLPTELMKKQLAEPGSRGMSHVSLTPVMIPVQSWIPSRRIISLIPFHPSHERSRRKFGESKPNKAKNPRTCIHRLERSRHEGKDHVSSHARRYRLRR